MWQFSPCVTKLPRGDFSERVIWGHLGSFGVIWGDSRSFGSIWVWKSHMIKCQLEHPNFHLDCVDDHAEVSGAWENFENFWKFIFLTCDEVFEIFFDVGEIRQSQQLSLGQRLRHRLRVRLVRKLYLVLHCSNLDHQLLMCCLIIKSYDDQVHSVVLIVLQNYRQFKGSSDASHFIFEIYVGKSRIRVRTTLKLNSLTDSNSMSDPTLSNIYFKNKMAWVWTTLNAYAWNPRNFILRSSSFTITLCKKISFFAFNKAPMTVWIVIWISAIIMVS